MEALDTIEKRLDNLNQLLGGISCNINYNTTTNSTSSSTINPSTATTTANITATTNNTTTTATTIDDGSGFKGENLTDGLLSAHTLISSAMSGREIITNVVKRSDELERLLDPNYLDEKQDLKAKEVYVNTVAPELAANFESLEKIKALEPTLGAEYFRNIPDVKQDLKSMNDNTSELHQENDLLVESLTLAMQRYDEIQNGIKESLKKMNERLDHIEECLKQRKKTNIDN